jgi:hypothetical protein
LYCSKHLPTPHPCLFPYPDPAWMDLSPPVWMPLSIVLDNLLQYVMSPHSPYIESNFFTFRILLMWFSSPYLPKDPLEQNIGSLPLFQLVSPLGRMWRWLLYLTFWRMMTTNVPICIRLCGTDSGNLISNRVWWNQINFLVCRSIAMSPLLLLTNLILGHSFVLPHCSSHWPQIVGILQSRERIPCLFVDVCVALFMRLLGCLYHA